MIAKVPQGHSQGSRIDSATFPVLIPYFVIALPSRQVATLAFGHVRVAWPDGVRVVAGAPSVRQLGVDSYTGTRLRVFFQAVRRQCFLVLVVKL